MKEKVIGIIGGMGPEATASLFIEIIKATPVQCDQDHYRIIVDNNPKIPDRTAAIFGMGNSPVPLMRLTAQNLDKLCVHVAGIPCITAHYFIDEIRTVVSYKILSALEELNKYISENYSKSSSIGVLCTSGTIKTGLFNRYLLGKKIIYPCKKTQDDKVMEAIYGANGIKKGNTSKYPRELLIDAGTELIGNGAMLIIGGCTELPLVIKDGDFNIPFLNPISILAKALVNYKVSNYII